MSGDICGCHDRGAPGIEWVGARDAAPHPTEARTAPHREQPGLSVHSVEGAGGPCPSALGRGRPGCRFARGTCVCGCLSSRLLCMPVLTPQPRLEPRTPTAGSLALCGSGLPGFASPAVRGPWLRARLSSGQSCESARMLVRDPGTARPNPGGSRAQTLAPAADSAREPECGHHSFQGTMSTFSAGPAMPPVLVTGSPLCSGGQVRTPP